MLGRLGFGIGLVGVAMVLKQVGVLPDQTGLPPERVQQAMQNLEGQQPDAFHGEDKARRAQETFSVPSLVPLGTRRTGAQVLD